MEQVPLPDLNQHLNPLAPIGRPGLAVPLPIADVSAMPAARVDAASDRSGDRSTSSPETAEITSLFELLGVGTSIATGVTLGLFGYYAHELVDPEVEVALLPEIPTADEHSRRTAAQGSDGVQGIVSPEFLPSLGNELRQWGSDLRRFGRALTTPRSAPQLAIANRDLTPQYPANPTIERWLDRASGIPSVENPSATSASVAGSVMDAQQLDRAMQQAMNGQFAAAIVILQQIPQASPHFEAAQTKLADYTESRDVQARGSLQTAYDLAAAGDFGGALVFLGEIPAEASVAAIAQQKRLEYTQKRDVQAQTWLYRAKNLAAQTRYNEAIAVLRIIPQGTVVYGEAKQKVLEYHQTLATITQQSPSNVKLPLLRDR